MQCRKCRSNEIKSRSNYSHGRKSKPMRSFTCRKCGSTDIESQKKRWNKR